MIIYCHDDKRKNGKHPGVSLGKRGIGLVRNHLGRAAFREGNEGIPRPLPEEGAGLCTMV